MTFSQACDHDISSMLYTITRQESLQYSIIKWLILVRCPRGKVHVLSLYLMDLGWGTSKPTPPSFKSGNHQSPTSPVDEPHTYPRQCFPPGGGIVPCVFSSGLHISSIFISPHRGPIQSLVILAIGKWVSLPTS